MKSNQRNILLLIFCVAIGILILVIDAGSLSYDSTNVSEEQRKVIQSDIQFEEQDLKNLKVEKESIFNGFSSDKLDEEKIADTENLEFQISEQLKQSRKKMFSMGFRFLDESTSLYKHFKDVYEEEPFKFKVINNGADIIRARVHPKGDIIISHSKAEALHQVATDKDTFLEKVSSEIDALDINSVSAADNYAYVSNVIFPLGQQFSISIYDFSCSVSQCILLTSYETRELVFKFIRAIEEQERYTLAWAYPIRETKTEAVFLKFK